MSRESNFDAIRCMNIKILQLRWCSLSHLEFTVTFSFFYLFDRKFADLMIFLNFLQGKMCALKKSARKTSDTPPSAPDQNLSRPVLASQYINKLKIQ